jgi:hypothetical protein
MNLNRQIDQYFRRASGGDYNRLCELIDAAHRSPLSHALSAGVSESEMLRWTAHEIELMSDTRGT